MDGAASIQKIESDAKARQSKQLSKVETRRNQRTVSETSGYKWTLHSHFSHPRLGHNVQIYSKPGGGFEVHHKEGSRSKIIQLHGEKEMESHADSLVSQMGFVKVNKPILGEEEQVELPKNKTLVEKGAKVVKDAVKGKTMTGQPKEKINTQPMTADGVTSDNAGPQVKSATL